MDSKTGNIDRRDTRPPNVIIVFFEQGPIIPVVDVKVSEVFRKYIETLYVLKGATNARTVQLAITQ